MPQNELVRTITCEILDLESTNLAQICTLGSFCLGLYMGSVDRDLQGHLGLQFQGVSHNWGCAYQKHEGVLIGGFTWGTRSAGGAYFYCLKLIG